MSSPWRARPSFTSADQRIIAPERAFWRDRMDQKPRGRGARPSANASRLGSGCARLGSVDLLALVRPSILLSISDIAEGAFRFSRWRTRNQLASAAPAAAPLFERLLGAEARRLPSNFLRRGPATISRPPQRSAVRRPRKRARPPRRARFAGAIALGIGIAALQRAFAADPVKTGLLRPSPSKVRILPFSSARDKGWGR